MNVDLIEQLPSMVAQHTTVNKSSRTQGDSSNFSLKKLNDRNARVESLNDVFVAESSPEVAGVSGTGTVRQPK